MRNKTLATFLMLMIATISLMSGTTAFAIQPLGSSASRIQPDAYATRPAAFAIQANAFLIQPFETHRLSRQVGILTNPSAQASWNDAASIPVQTEAEWIKFTSPEGRFAVLLPHEPKVEKTSATESNPITNYRYSALESGYGFICEYFDAVSTGDDLQKFLDITRDGIISGAGSTLVGEEKISLNSYPGRELQLALKVNDGVEPGRQARL